MKVTNRTILNWINENLGKVIRKAIEGTPYTEELLAGIVRREVGHKLAMYIRKQLKNPEKWTFEFICKKMKGDWGIRWKETYPRYHGFGFWQIDVRSFPDFVRSGKWQDPYECCKQAIKCLEEKAKDIIQRRYVIGRRLTIAAYNCGVSQVIKALKNNKDVDYYTYNKDYSKSVLDFAEQYEKLFMKHKKINNIPIKPIEPIDKFKTSL